MYSVYSTSVLLVLVQHPCSGSSFRSDPLLGSALSVRLVRGLSHPLPPWSLRSLPSPTPYTGPLPGVQPPRGAVPTSTTRSLFHCLRLSRAPRYQPNSRVLRGEGVLSLVQKTWRPSTVSESCHRTRVVLNSFLSFPVSPCNPYHRSCTITFFFHKDPSVPFPLNLFETFCK